MAFATSPPRRIPPSNSTLNPVAHRVDHGRQHAQRRGDPVELTSAVVRHDDGLDSYVDRAPRVVVGLNALEDNRALPHASDPGEIAPRHDRLLERSDDVGVRHGAASRQDDVRKVHQPAVAEEPASHRGRSRSCGTNGSMVAAPAAKLPGAVANIAFAESGDRRVDRHHERGEAAGARAHHRRRRDVPAAHEVQLVQPGPLRRRLDVFEPAPRERRQNVGDARFTRGKGGDRSPSGIEEAAASQGRQEQRQRNRLPQDRGVEYAVRCVDGSAGPPRELAEGADVLAEGPLVLGAPVDVLEHHSG